MIARQYPVLRIRFGIGRYQGEATALVDTGCDAPFVVPEALVPRLPGSRLRRRTWTVSGRELVVTSWLETLDLVEQPGDVSLEHLRPPPV
ncbi:MAG: hypothetical protein ACR2PL_00760 [Dehalococcoidia bacterium]